MIRLSFSIQKALNHWALRSAAVVMAALAIEYITQFGRSIALSRLLGPTEFGIGSAIVILWVLVDMSTGVGADRYLIQASDGDTGEALAAVHAVTLIRNVLSSCLILVMAFPTASLLGIPQARGSFLWLAVIPLIRGFEHLELTQRQRRQQFLPWALAIGSTNIFGLASVTVAAFVCRDHRAVLFSLAAQAVGLVATTHLLARAPYRISRCRAPVLRTLRFGLPLMLNGLSLAAMGQIDRLTVGSFLGVIQLGRYGLATMLFFLPVSLIARILNSTFTPKLAVAWHRSPGTEFPWQFRKVCLGMAALAIPISAAVALAGRPLVALIFGSAYTVEDSFFSIIALVVMMKFAKVTFNFGGIAMGKTRDVMLSNIPNACGLAVTVGGLTLYPHLSAAAIGALVGETLGAFAAFMLLKRHLRDERFLSWLPILSVVLLPCIAAGWCCAMSPQVKTRVVALGLAGLFAVVGLAIVPRLRSFQAAGAHNRPLW